LLLKTFNALIQAKPIDLLWSLEKVIVRATPHVYPAIVGLADLGRALDLNMKNKTVGAGRAEKFVRIFGSQRKYVFE
jgi:hypothetical protein